MELTIQLKAVQLADNFQLLDPSQSIIAFQLKLSFLFHDLCYGLDKNFLKIFMLLEGDWIMECYTHPGIHKGGSYLRQKLRTNVYSPCFVHIVVIKFQRAHPP